MDSLLELPCFHRLSWCRILWQSNRSCTVRPPKTQLPYKPHRTPTRLRHASDTSQIDLAHVADKRLRRLGQALRMYTCLNTLMPHNLLNTVRTPSCNTRGELPVGSLTRAFAASHRYDACTGPPIDAIWLRGLRRPERRQVCEALQPCQTVHRIHADWMTAARTSVPVRRAVCCEW